MALFAAYVVYQMGEWGLPIGLALIVGIAVGFALGAAAEVALVRPISKKSPFAVFIVTIGLFQFLNWLDGAIWGDQVLPNSGVGSKQPQYPSLFPDQPDDFVKIGRRGDPLPVARCHRAHAGDHRSAVPVVQQDQVRARDAGRGEQPESAKLVGIRTNTVLMVSWGLAAAIGAIGGVVFAGINNSVSLGLMFTVFIYGSAAATLGGFDSPAVP
jgi:branched-chain amino acid transport system permease protein